MRKIIDIIIFINLKTGSLLCLGVSVFNFYSIFNGRYDLVESLVSLFIFTMVFLSGIMIWLLSNDIIRSE